MDAILDQIAERFLDNLASSISFGLSIVSAESPVERLHVILRAVLLTARNHPIDAAAVLKHQFLSGMRSQGKDSRWHEIAGLVEQTIEEGMGAGEIVVSEPISARMLSRVFLSMTERSLLPVVLEHDAHHEFWNEATAEIVVLRTLSTHCSPATKEKLGADIAKLMAQVTSA